MKRVVYKIMTSQKPPDLFLRASSLSVVFLVVQYETNQNRGEYEALSLHLPTYMLLVLRSGGFSQSLRRLSVCIGGS